MRVRKESLPIGSPLDATTRREHSPFSYRRLYVQAIYATRVKLEARAVTYQLGETFVISRGATDESESVVAEVTHAGVTGHGEGPPIARYDEAAAGAGDFLNGSGDALGDDRFA